MTERNLTPDQRRAPVAGEAQLLADIRAFLGEGPVWDPARAVIDWVDIMAARLHSTNIESGDTATLVLPAPVGCIAPRARGGWVAALADGFWAVDPDGATQPLAAVDADRPDLRFNDGRCDPAGRLWAGTMALDFRADAGTLYRLDPDLSVHRMVAPVTISNGIDWSPDARTMYYVDTPTRRIDAFDYHLASGDIGNRRSFARIEPGAGSPDGLVVDAEGGIWVALWDGWRVRRYLPDGTIDREIRVPVAEVSSLAFGGPELDQLFITTAWQLLDAAEHARQPLAGGLFRADPGVRGRLAVPFAG
jgi:sugar lactone lactonase YvrE